MDVIHLRVVSPAERTAEVVERLAGEKYVANLIVLPGSARHPDGDWIECDIHTGVANSVLADLRALGVDRDGSLTLQPLDLALSGRIDRAARGRLGALVHTPVWAEVEARIRGFGSYAPSFHLFLVIAGLIGAIGLLTNSQILIVAAMIVGPEYGAITSVALGIDRGDRQRIAEGLRALGIGFGLAVVAALGFTGLVRVLGLTPPAFALGIRPVSHLIDTPDFFSLVVAILAGIVGVVALTHTQTSTLLGVFVSVTTIPAAADVGVALAAGSPGEAWGSLVQLLLNVVLLILVGFVTLRAQRAMWARVSRRWAREHPGAG